MLETDLKVANFVTTRANFALVRANYVVSNGSRPKPRQSIMALTMHHTICTRESKLCCPERARSEYVEIENVSDCIAFRENPRLPFCYCDSKICTHKSKIRKNVHKI